MLAHINFIRFGFNVLVVLLTDDCNTLCQNPLEQGCQQNI